jgi:hypothetical protein
MRTQPTLEEKASEARQFRSLARKESFLPVRARTPRDEYGPNYRKPWVRRAFPHQRTHLGDHREQVLLIALVIVLVALALVLYLQARR